MVKAIPRVLGRIIWPALVTSIVVLAIYVSGGRVLMAALPGLQQQMIQALSQQLPFRVSVGAVVGRMDGFSPRIELRDLTVLDEQIGPALSLREASLRIDPWQSLLSGTLRADVVTLIAPKMLRPMREGQRMPEFPEAFWEILNSFGRVQVRDAQLAHQSDSDAKSSPVTFDLDLERERSQRRVRLSVRSGDDVVMTAEGTGTGNPGEITQFSGEIHGAISGQGLSILASNLGVGLDAEGGINFWYGVSEGAPSSVVQVALSNIIFRGDHGGTLDSLSLQSAVRGVPGELEIWLDDILIGLPPGELVALPRIHTVEAAQGWQIRTGAFDVGAVVQVLTRGAFLPEKARNILDTLAPSGRINAMELLLASPSQPLDTWALAADVSDITTAPYRNVPGLAGIDAYLSATERGAVAWIDTDNFSLSLPKVYDRPIQLQKVVGQLAGQWQPDGLFLKDGLFLARAAEYSASVQFEINIPFSASSSVDREMRLTAAMSEAPIAVRNDYIPHRVPEPTYKWLQKAIGSGTVGSATFLWHGGLGPYGDPGQTMQLVVDMSGVNLDYQEAWPQAVLSNGRLWLNDGLIDIWANSVTLAGIDLENARAGVRLHAGEARLLLGAESQAQLSPLTAAMKKLPALSFARPLLDDLSAQGNARTHLDLSFDLARIRETLSVQVSTSTMGARVSSAFLDLGIEDLEGEIVYDSSRGFEGRGLQAELFGQPIQVDMGPHLASGAGSVLAAQFSVLASVDDILAWRSSAALLPASGSATVHVMTEVAEEITVSVTSNLEGVEVDLPLPWGKGPQTRAPLAIDWSSRGWAPWEVFWFGRLSAVGDFSDPIQPALAIDVTPRTRASKSRLVSPPPGVQVTGFLPSFDPADWLPDLLGSEVIYSELPELHIDQLRIERLLWQGRELGSATLSASVADPVIEADFALPWIRGVLRQWEPIPLADSAAMTAAETRRTLDIEYLDLASVPSSSKQSNPQKYDWVSNWMPLSVSVKEVYRGHTSLGAIQFEVDGERGWEVTQVRGDLLGINWGEESHLIWRADESEERTELVLAAQIQDISESLELLGVSPIMETRSGALEANWEWEGGPTDFELPAVAGTLTLDMQSGSFTSAKAEAEGAMRLLSLMNLSGLFRRANINQLFDPGVTFDSAKGRFEFDRGILRIPEFSVEGSGGYFSFVSEIDLNKELLDGELVVTLPLVENIPWVAALAGGLPVAAGTYLVSKVFEDQVNQLSSGIYSVSGNLDDPQVVFERVFDAKSRLPDKTDQSSSGSSAVSEAR